jgi:6-phospho-3-hexuloisomerase
MAKSFAESQALILRELRESLASLRNEQVERLLQAILTAKTVFVVGAGRMGILLSTFSMRLNHLGFTSFVVGSVNCPPLCEQDLLIVGSSSGETPSVREIVRIAREQKATIATITASPSSTIARMASFIVCIQAPSSLTSSESDATVSEQPMKTQFEQTLFIVLEALVLTLMDRTGQTSLDLVRRHGNLE